MSITRKLQRNYEKQQEKEEHESLLTPEQMKLPSGKVVTSPVKGEFMTLPLLGWCAIRKREEIPLVMLGLALLKDNTIRGVLHIELPVYKDETDRAVVAALERYGWTGDVWKPGSELWPTGDAENQDQLVAMMKQAGLSASLTFPPNETGNVSAQAVEVMRARGDFLMPPLPEPESVNEDLLQKLHAILQNASQFYPLN